MDYKDLRRDVLDFGPGPGPDAGDIGVAESNGAVTLMGHVGGHAEEVETERAVRRARGVRAMAREIQVRPADERRASDDQLAARALDIIDWSVHLLKDAVQVEAAGGWVTLTGAVHWQFQVAEAGAAVRKLSGVLGVTNLIVVGPDARPQAIRNRILEAFTRCALFEADAIKVMVSGDEVILEGAVATSAERDAAERVARSVPGVRSIEDRIVALS